MISKTLTSNMWLNNLNIARISKPYCLRIMVVSAIFSALFLIEVDRVVAV